MSNPGNCARRVRQNRRAVRPVLPAGRRSGCRERVSMLDPVRVNSLGYRTDLMLRLLEGGQVVDHGDYLVLHSPQNPMFWWGNFLLMPESALRDEADTWVSRFAPGLPGCRAHGDWRGWHRRTHRPAGEL